MFHFNERIPPRQRHPHQSRSRRPEIRLLYPLRSLHVLHLLPILCPPSAATAFFHTAPRHATQYIVLRVPRKSEPDNVVPLPTISEQPHPMPSAFAGSDTSCASVAILHLLRSHLIISHRITSHHIAHFHRTPRRALHEALIPSHWCPCGVMRAVVHGGDTLIHIFDLPGVSAMHRT